MAEREPPRHWLEAAEPELPHELLAGLRACAEDGPSQAQQQRMRESMLRSVAAGSAAAPAAWKLASLLVLAGVGSGLWWSMRAVPEPERSNPASAREHAAQSTPGAPGAMPASAEANALAGSGPAENARPAESTPTGGAPARVPAPRATPAQRAAGPVPGAKASSELELLTRARRALGSLPARTLELAAEHARRYGQGTFGQERELLAIEALIKLQRATEARERAAHFTARYPRSAHLARIRVLVGAP